MTKYYVYYSYEEFGRGYIGYHRRSKTRAPLDDNYYGSFSDESFKPTQKIILGEYDSKEDAISAEMTLHLAYNVHKNRHFANRACQSSPKFYGHTCWNKGKKNLQSHSDEWKQAASARNSGTKNYFYEGKKFDWINDKTGKIELNISVLEMLEKYPELSKKLYYVASGVRPHTRNWRLYKVISSQAKDKKEA